LDLAGGSCDYIVCLAPGIARTPKAGSSIDRAVHRITAVSTERKARQSRHTLNLAVISKYPPRPEGISEYGQHVAGALACRPEIERLTVIANRADASPLASGKLEIRRVWRPNDVLLVRQVTHELLRIRPDAVWFNVSFAMFGDRLPALGGFLLPAISRRLGARAVVTLHEFPAGRLADIGIKNGPFHRAGLRAALALLRQADALCVTIAGGKQQLAGRLPSDVGRIWHVPLCSYYAPTLEPFGSSPTILVLTSHAPHKNIPLLLRSFRRVRDRIPKCRLILAGIDHPRFPGYLAQLRDTYGEQPGVEWRGPVATAEIPELFRQAQLVVAPYAIATGSSATVHQAIGAGRPVVVTDLPEFRAIAEEEDLWLEFFPNNDSGRLAETLAELLDDPGRCRAIAEHNHRSALRHSLVATADTYLALLGGSVSFPGSTPDSPSPYGARWQSISRSP
jgi:glycosyltransferase involved in cell wall biosynthesis